MKKTLLLLVALITATIAFARTEINGIYYNLNYETKTAEVYGSNKYSGDITIPEKVTHNATEYSVTSIGEMAFCNCSSLTSITIPNSVTYIGDYAFNSCDALTSISIPNSVTSIGNAAFSWCSSLTSITIPNSVTSIGDYVFYGCSSLTSITIPNSVTSIGNSAFSYCSSLTSIDVEANNQNYASIDGVLYNKEITTLISCPTGKTSITIPNSVTSIGDGAFYSCSSLTSIDVEANNQNYASIDGVLYNKEITTLICYPGGKTSITIPNSVTSIGNWAFASCSSQTSITIPNSVTSIGYNAFYDCSSLTSITIPNSVTSIGDWAFSGCYNLTSIICLGSTPPSANDLGADTENCTLIVPSEAYNNYLQHAYWGQFFDKELLIKTNPTIINKGYKGEIIILYNPFVGNKGMIDAMECYAHTGLITKESNSNYDWKYCHSEWRADEDKYKMTKEGDFWKLVIPNIYEYYECPESEEILKLAFVFNDGPNGYKEGKTANGNDIFINLVDSTIEQYEIIVTSNENGTVIGGGFYNENEVVILTANPNSGYRFTQWSDGNTDNPRIITVTENKTYTAEFEVAEATNVETSKISSANIYTTNGTLHIEGATENYHILDAAGRLIYSGNATTLQLPRGIYLITMGGEVEKIVL